MADAPDPLYADRPCVLRHSSTYANAPGARCPECGASLDMNDPLYGQPVER